ncbi:MAG: glycosyltransferase [Candidatus Blackburnbacteria bacterium]|nr:glycosyltransferase [Candidatus Blackburnbacteria bacterium]
MNVLMLTPYLPYPPSSGGQIRSYNLIKQLSKKHKITLYSLIKHDEERRYIGELEKHCVKVKVFKRPAKPWTFQNILKTGTGPYPFLMIRNFSPEEKRDLSRVLRKEKFDIIHAETFYVSLHIPKNQIPIVLVDQTIEYEVYQHFVENFKWPLLKPLLMIDVWKIKFWETYYWKRATGVIALSERDAQSMKKLVSGLRVSVVPNGVGEDLMRDVPLHFCKTIIFVGNYAWLQNVEAVEILVKEIYPRVVKVVKDVKLLIVGQNTDKIPVINSPGIEVVDLKIEDVAGVQKAYHEGGIMVAPLYGPSGARLKIVGAMAAKVPVVTTSIGILGIDATDREDVLLSDTYEGISKKAIKLLTDVGLYRKIALNARKLVEKKYTYEVIAEKLDAVYKDATHGKS